MEFPNDRNFLRLSALFQGKFPDNVADEDRTQILKLMHEHIRIQEFRDFYKHDHLAFKPLKDIWTQVVQSVDYDIWTTLFQGKFPDNVADEDRTQILKLMHEHIRIQEFRDFYKHDHLAFKPLKDIWTQVVQSVDYDIWTTLFQGKFPDNVADEDRTQILKLMHEHIRSSAESIRLVVFGAILLIAVGIWQYIDYGFLLFYFFPAIRHDPWKHILFKLAAFFSAGLIFASILNYI
jgi:putative sterol carrier protein